MSELLNLALPNLYGTMTVIERVDTTTGVVRYVVSGRRIAGVFVFEPDVHRDEPVPTRVCVRYGDGPAHYHREEDRTDRPIVNGIDLVGSTVVDPNDAQSLTRWRLNIRRPTGLLTSVSVPDKTADHVTAVITALLDRWRTLPVRGELMLAAARRTADKRIADVRHYYLEPCYRQRDELAAQIHQHESLIEQLQQLTHGAPDPGRASLPPGRPGAVPVPDPGTGRHAPGRPAAHRRTRPPISSALDNIGVMRRSTI